MKISQAFPSKYLKHADLDGREASKKISFVEQEKVGMNGDVRPVLHFVGEERGFILNKTNARTMSAAYGDDTEGWRGKAITLYPTRVDFRGTPTDTIRVRVTAQELDDSIPF
jgi:hypothetical protein